MNAARGGAKPYMLPGGQDVTIEVNGQAKSGVYEVSARMDVLARRVELPGWLSDFWTQKRGDLRERVLEAQAPVQEIHESRGHIYLKPPARLFNCPAVGLDLEVFDLLCDHPELRRVKFFVYATGYRLAGVWTIRRPFFILRSRRVETKASFMPQMMVALTELA